MKTFRNIITKIILATVVAMSFAGCNDLLDREPLDIISDKAVWSDPNLIKGYLLGLYDKAPTRRSFHGGFPWGAAWDDGNAEGAYEPDFYSVYSDDARSGYNWTNSVQLNIVGFDRSTKDIGYWDYKLIRDCNFMINQIDNGKLKDDEKQAFKAEARFIRAMAYFELVKRYGGVPLITTVQTIDLPEEELFPKRKTEKEIYDFIINECTEIAALLPKTNEEGRANSATALALLSRAALYAGSIARYGKVELNGIVGINADANEYFQKSFDASQKIIKEYQYALYERHSNKVENYRQLFLDEKNNPEIIFKRSFDGVSKGHSFNFFNVLQGYGSGWGSYLQPSLNLVDAYDFIDGRNGAIDWENVKGPLSSILAQKDPRLHATLYFEGNKYPGADPSDTVKTYIIYGDTAGNGKYTYLDKSPQEWRTWRINGQDIVAQNCGKNSVPAAVDGAYTGFFIRKFIKDEEVRAAGWQSSTDWIEFRLGEILLNYAEAAFELGKTDIALEAVNKIRKRAGVAELSEITMEKIRNERRVELAFEAHRIWDIRRWRIAEEVFSKPVYGIQVIWKLPDNEISYIKYVADTRQNDGYLNNKTKTRYFPERMYYLPLGEDKINNNPNLVENPGY